MKDEFRDGVNLTNLRKHVNFLKENPDLGFSMESFTEDGDVCSGDMDNLCGTSACSLGWAPKWAPQDIIRACLIQPNDSLIGGFYEKLSNELFGIRYNNPLWDWLFSDDWTDIDNTLEGARCRIEYFLEHKDIHDCPNPDDEQEVDEYFELIEPYKLDSTVDSNPRV